MTQQQNLPTPTIFSKSLTAKMLVGAVIGLVLIGLYLIGIKNPDPSWGALWMIRPIVMLLFAGAMSGLVFHIMHHYRKINGWNIVLVNIACIIICIIGMWMGFVLGLDGTLWD